jgi:hypothetical protein
MTGFQLVSGVYAARRREQENSSSGFIAVSTESTSTSSRYRASLAPVIAASMAWAVIFIAIPFEKQDFPLDDDWGYALGAFQFARGEGINYFGWCAMPLLGQWVWAYPFIQLLGSTNAALRVSTIVLSWVGVTAFRDLLRQAGLGPWVASFGALVLLFNPLFFMMMGTFMSDVPALSFSLLALACYQRGFTGGGHPGYQLAACVAATLVGVNRQNALAVPAVAAVLLLQRPLVRWKPLPWATIAIPGVACLGTEAWFLGRPDVDRALPTLNVHNAVHMTLPLAVTLGLYSLPAVLLVGGRWRRVLLVAGVIGIAAAGHVAISHFARGKPWLTGGVFPYTGNVLTIYGTYGHEAEVLGERTILIDEGWRVALTVLGCLGVAVVLVRLRADRWTTWLRQPLVLYTLFQIPFLLIARGIFDRYFLVFLPGTLLIVLLGAKPTRRDWFAGCCVLAMFAGLAIALTHDWLSYNSARWELGRRAVAAGVPLTELEGGFEWVNWFAPYPESDAPPSADPGLAVFLSRVRHPNRTPRYGLSFSPLPGTRVIDRQPYVAWLTRKPQAFYLVEQTSSARP